MCVASSRETESAAPGRSGGPSPRPIRRTGSVRGGDERAGARRPRPVTFRGFIAVDIPPSPPLESFADQLRNASASLKVVSTDQVHLTVKFLGDTEEGLVPEIVATIREACADVQPFPITVRGTGAFPSLSRMNVVWVGVEGAEPIGRIAADLEA